jgi:hypothetical protein
MDLEDLIVAWRKQEVYIGEHLRIGTLRHLLRVKSGNALGHIKSCLIKEVLVISLIIFAFDTLFFLVNIPLTPLRWSCLAIFNLIAGLYVISYQKVIRESRLEYKETLETNLQRIVQGLTRFQHVYRLNNIPVVLVCFLMFAGAQDLLILLPWMIVEFSILKWILLPKLTSRFEDYRADLEHSLKQLREIRD